jgi:hypothetical protein
VNKHVTGKILAKKNKIPQQAFPTAVANIHNCHLSGLKTTKQYHFLDQLVFIFPTRAVGLQTWMIDVLPVACLTNIISLSATCLTNIANPFINIRLSVTRLTDIANPLINARLRLPLVGPSCFLSLNSIQQLRNAPDSA